MQSIDEQNPKLAAFAASQEIPKTKESPRTRHDQLAKILRSTAFRNSTTLQRMLEFIVEKAEKGQLTDLDEYSIAVQVLGRKPTFDPSADTSVRTQAYRLRTKLKDYYASEGASDQLIVEVPKGHYVPSFTIRGEVHPPHTQEMAVDAEQTIASIPSPPNPKTPLFRYPRLFALAAGIGGVLVTIGVIGLFNLVHPVHRSSPVHSGPDAEVAFFWNKPSSKNGVVVAFTDPEFLESESGTLSPYSGIASADRGASFTGAQEAAQHSSAAVSLLKPLYYEDGFTGTGEVFAVGSLANMLRSMNLQMILLRSPSLSASDFRDHDIVFLGSPRWNVLLYNVEVPQRFRFISNPVLWQSEIEDTSATSVQARFLRVVRDAHTHVILADYALFQVFPAPSSGHRIILLAGLTTTGTQGAAAFATSANGLAQIRKLLSTHPGREDSLPDYFECLLRVKAAGGLDALHTAPVSCVKTK